jgi:hypothetical protein
MAATFTIEDGSGIANANAYSPVVFVDDYHDSCGNSVWQTLDDSTKTTSIVRATFYIDKRFGRKFRGYKQNIQQPLQWPRLDAFDDSGFMYGNDGKLPLQLLKACAEYALRAALYMTLAPDPLLPAPAQDLSDAAGPRATETISGTVTRKLQRVGPLEEETAYETNAMSLSRRQGTEGNRVVQSTLVNDFNIPEYPEADMWLEELIRTGGVAASLSRGD